MGIEDELKRQGYKLEYESSDGEDRKQVWVNEKRGMAVRIEWMRVDGEAKGGIGDAAPRGPEPRMSSVPLVVHSTPLTRRYEPQSNARSGDALQALDEFPIVVAERLRRCDCEDIRPLCLCARDCSNQAAELLLIRHGRSFHKTGDAPPNPVQRL